MLLQGEYEFKSVEMKNCDSESLIKILPNSWFRINNKCELIVHVCHNVTEVLRPVRANAVLYQNSMKLINFTRTLGCKKLRAVADLSLDKTMLTLNGLKQCKELKKGVSCQNLTAFKYNKDGEKVFKMLMMTIASGETYRLKDNVTFEKDKKSCLELKIVAKRETL